MLSINEQSHIKMRQNRISATLEKSYLQWIEAFINYHDGRHPILMGSNELKSFILYLDYKLHLPEMTIRHVYHALEFLYLQVLESTMPQLSDIYHTKPLTKAS